jgi:hypothetical protein
MAKVARNFAGALKLNICDPWHPSGMMDRVNSFISYRMYSPGARTSGTMSIQTLLRDCGHMRHLVHIFSGTTNMSQRTFGELTQHAVLMTLQDSYISENYVRRFGFV